MGGQPPYQPYGAPGGPPPGGGFPAWAIWTIIGTILAIGGAIAAIVLLGGEDVPEGPIPTQGLSPTAAPTITDITPLPTGTTEPPEEPGVDCASAPPGRLIECVPTQIGQFQLVEWDNAPQFASTFNSNSAIEVEFRRPDATEVLHYLFSYNTSAEASIERQNYINAFKDIGFTEVATERSRGIRVTRLAREEEVLVWSNGLIMAVVEGPFDVTTGFFGELPY